MGWTTAWTKAWIHGGSPTKGFLSNVEAGPFAATFQSIAGATWGLGKRWARLPFVSSHSWAI